MKILLYVILAGIAIFSIKKLSYVPPSEQELSVIKETFLQNLQETRQNNTWPKVYTVQLMKDWSTNPEKTIKFHIPESPSVYFPKEIVHSFKFKLRWPDFDPHWAYRRIQKEAAGKHWDAFEEYIGVATAWDRKLKNFEIDVRISSIRNRYSDNAPLWNKKNRVLPDSIARDFDVLNRMYFLGFQPNPHTHWIGKRYQILTDGTIISYSADAHFIPVNEDVYPDLFMRCLLKKSIFARYQKVLHQYSVCTISRGVNSQYQIEYSIPPSQISSWERYDEAIVAHINQFIGQ